MTKTVHQNFCAKFCLNRLKRLAATIVTHTNVFRYPFVRGYPLASLVHNYPKKQENVIIAVFQAPQAKSKVVYTVAHVSSDGQLVPEEWCTFHALFWHGHAHAHAHATHTMAKNIRENVSLSTSL